MRVFIAAFRLLAQEWRGSLRALRWSYASLFVSTMLLFALFAKGVVFGVLLPLHRSRQFADPVGGWRFGSETIVCGVLLLLALIFWSFQARKAHRKTLCELRRLRDVVSPPQLETSPTDERSASLSGKMVRTASSNEAALQSSDVPPATLAAATPKVLDPEQRNMLYTLSALLVLSVLTIHLLPLCYFLLAVLAERSAFVGEQQHTLPAGQLLLLSALMGWALTMLALTSFYLRLVFALIRLPHAQLSLLDRMTK